MAKRNIIVAVSVGVSIFTAVMGFVAYKAITSQTTEDVVRVSDQRREAKQLLALCDNTDAVKLQLAEGTSKFEAYIASDPKHGRQVLADTVMPVIDSRELACNQAQRDITEVKRSLTKPDPFVDEAAPRVDAMVAKLAKAKSAATELLAAFDRSAPPDELLAKLQPLRTAMN
ncbi:MAG TPA: hypothetical protein VIV58_29765 [Kofleriaceae bacterium]